MSDVIKPGAGVLFMKVGTHANEPLADIVARKQGEIEAAGYGLWGYGGNTCHPTTMVQPFARDFELRGEEIHLVMQPMVSNHFAITARAKEMSTDGLSWQAIPEPINVVGSRYALAIEELEVREFALPLDHTRVAAGNSRGRRGDEYVKGRVDKAVLEVVEEEEELSEPETGEAAVAPIGLVARLVPPYAVFVKN